MAFISCALHNNSNGTSSGTLLLTEYVLTTSNSSMTITNGYINITHENDLSCTCFDSTRYDSLITSLDSTAIVNFSFENYFDLSSDTMSICTGDSIILIYPDSVLYNWSNGSTENYIIPKNSEWYSVTMMQGKDTITDSIFVNNMKSFDFVFPNIYTPNNDLVNDSINIDSHFFVHLELYNRWGVCIYKHLGNGIQIKDLNISDGSYFYILRVEGKCVTHLSKQKGWIQILR